MTWFHSRSNLIYGALFGGWLGGVVAFVTQAVNWLSLPGIPLAQPNGNFTGYLAQYIFLGMLLGIVSAIPEHRFAGALVGSFTVVLLNSVLSLVREWGFTSFSGTLVTVLLMFLPLTVLLAPLVLLIRLGVDAQHVDPDRPYLWPRRFLIPLLLTLVAVVAGSFSLYSADTRSAFRYMDEMIRQGLQAEEGGLPAPLEDVKEIRANARGSYSLEWSDRLDTYMGPRPVGSELSQFLIIARFENGFSLACVFSDGRSVPSCTNY